MKMESSGLKRVNRKSMGFVRLILVNHSYDYKYASDIHMCILGDFLTSDVGCYWPSFKSWALYEPENSVTSNITALERENGIIYLRDLYSEEEVPQALEMTVSQFVQILDEWEEKVCKKKPAEVVIKHEEGKFWIETSE